MEHENVIVMSPEYTKAMQLDRHIKVHAQMTQESLYEVCKGLKEMRDGKLYKELGYQNFAEYCENEVGIKRRQAYNYISVAEKLSENFVQSTAQIGTEKLALLAKLDESDREQIQQETDVETATVKQLREKIRELKEQKQKLKIALGESGEKRRNLVKENEQLAFAVSASHQETEKVKAKFEVHIAELENQIQELENRPIETYHSEEDKQEIERLTVQNEALEEQCTELEQKIYAYESQEQTQLEKSPEYQNLMKAMHNNSHEWAEKYDALQEKSWQEMNELKRTHQAELERVRQESMKAPNNSDACLALAQSAHDAVSRLKRFLEAHPGASLYSAMYFKTVIERLVDIEAEQVEKGNVS